MEIPKGFKIESGSHKYYVLKLQAGKAWIKHLTDILIKKVVFKNSLVA